MCFVICYVRWHVGGGEGGRALELVEGPLEEFLARVLRRSDHDLGHLTLKKNQSRLENELGLLTIPGIQGTSIAGVCCRVHPSAESLLVRWGRFLRTTLRAFLTSRVWTTLL